MNDDYDIIKDLQSAFDEYGHSEKSEQISLVKEDAPPLEVRQVMPKTEVEKLIDKLPSEEQAKFYKIVSQVGLREDDYLWVLLYIMGYTKIMYEDLPKAINDASESIASAGKDLEPMIQQVVEHEVKKIKREFQEQISRLIDAQSDVSSEFKKGSNNYLQSMQVAQADIDNVILQKKSVIMENMTQTLKHVVPKIIDQQLANLRSDVDKLSSKVFVLALSAVLLGNLISGILGKIFGSIFS